MLQSAFFARCGIHVLPDALDRDACVHLRQQMLKAANTPATVTVGNAEDRLAKHNRSTAVADVPASAVEAVNGVLARVKPRLEERLGRSLYDWERPQFLVYTQGDFFRPHSDSSEDLDAPDWLRRRVVTVVLFLNDEADESTPASFSGGSLTFYGVFGQDSRGRTPGLALPARAGTLAAFPANMTHGVTEVTRGERCTAVSWSPTSERPPWR